MWKIAQGNKKPSTIEMMENEDLVYVRKNIHLIKLEDVELYEYEENSMPKIDWETYKDILDNSNQIDRSNARIEYVAMMSDIYLPEGE